MKQDQDQARYVHEYNAVFLPRTFKSKLIGYYHAIKNTLFDIVIQANETNAGRQFCY
jgi:hypothetical protein